MSRARDTAEVAEEIDLKVDYSTPVNEQTGTSYTFQLADARKLTTASSASAVTLTIPPQSEVTWENDTILRVVNYGAGAVTVAGGSGVTVTNTASTIGQYESAAAIRTGSDAWTLVPFGGGEIPAAEISSPSATGQYTDGNGDTWDYYRFTSSGTLTVDTAGFADILVIGGGGGGSRGTNSNRAGGGGGAGAYVNLSSAYLSADTHTVTIGAGGAASNVSAGLDWGHPGQSSVCGIYLAPGGGNGAPSAYSEQLNRLAGGSGGGGASNPSTNRGGAGLAGYGNDGGDGPGVQTASGGGGGGAGGVGGVGVASSNTANGGAGAANTITGTSVTYAAGGSGGGYNSSVNTVAGTANTGNGGGGGWGGGAGSFNDSAAGGSGIVIVRVKV